MKIAIVGSRTFDNYVYLSKQMNQFKSKCTAVVCGEARGADFLGRKWGKEIDVSIISFPAEWDKYGKGAGIIRNVKMAQVADIVCAFWDGKSRGTQHMIDATTLIGKKVYIFKMEKGEEFE